MKRLLFWTMIYFSFLVVATKSAFIYFEERERRANNSFLSRLEIWTHFCFYLWNLEVVCFNENWFHVGFHWCFWSRTVVAFFVNVEPRKKMKKSKRENKIQSVKYGPCLGCITWHCLKVNFNKWNVYINFGISLIFYPILTSIAACISFSGFNSPSNSAVLLFISKLIKFMWLHDWANAPLKWAKTKFVASE